MQTFKSPEITQHSAREQATDQKYRGGLCPRRRASPVGESVKNINLQRVKNIRSKFKFLEALTFDYKLYL